ncbi:uncharacterized protein LOC112042931 [Bicyclus anynana]|uniref:Uncharacterized protein LOC112042931 n=1 Tax=Bicyclus anynana TaxID=110368 RepID=A0A6J1MTW2_BICAN|nr:uncharacterized protein LOC112042931 [Bicyclus anynana]
MSLQSTASKDNKRRKIVDSEGRSMIASVYHFLKEEYDFSKLFAEPNCDLSHLQNISQRTAEATGVSCKTVLRILKEEKEMPSTSSKFPSPLKRKKRGSKIEIDNFTAEVVRSTIQNFHVHNEIPTLAKLKTVVNEKIGFNCCIETLRKFLLKLGYKWRKTETNRKVLTERHDVQMGRLKYLKKISEYRSQGRPIVYNETNNFLSTGTRFIFAYAGTKDGFIENATLIYKARSIAGDHNSNNMSNNDYIKWLNEKLLPNVPERSVIVLVNASYYKKRAEKPPTPATKKADMQQWLRDKGVPFEESLLKLELYDLIKKQINQNITYEIDELIESKGFDVLRLPPYHPELNAVENIWGIVKKYIALNSNEQMVTDAERLINESFNKINSVTWQNTCSHIEEIEKAYLKYFDLDFEFAIDLQDDSDESESESDNYISDSN